MMIKPKVRGFICTTAHPVGCHANIDQAIDSVRTQGVSQLGPKRVLVIGASTGYGLASRLVSCFGYGAQTMGVFFEKPGTDDKTASAGWYNTVAFEDEAKKVGIPAWSFNGDAFSHAMKKQVVACIQKHWPEGVDLVIYSLASPRRTDPDTGEVYQSCLKTLGETYTNQTVNIHTGEFSLASLTPATPEEVQGTIKVMGGDDWQLWIQTLLDNQCLAANALTLAYSYIGSDLTDPMYRSGTIGQAKKHLEETAKKMNSLLEEKIHGHAYISVNKAVVTQAAAAIPVLPLYCAILYQVMREAGLHEGCTEQIIRLFKDKIYGEKGIVLDHDQMIRMDDYELSREIQNEVRLRFKKINPDNVNAISDLDIYRGDFMRLFGFEVDGVDYEQDVAINLPMKSLEDIEI